MLLQNSGAHRAARTILFFRKQHAFTSPQWGEVASQRVRSEVAGPMTGSASG